MLLLVHLYVHKLTLIASLTDPPAGAAAIVFASGKVRWEHFGIFLSGVAITIITAVGINNMSDRRQYPTSWYLVNKAKKSIVGDNQLGQVKVIKKAP